MELVAAAAFTWLGMVLAISFLEAPLKFRAPGVTERLGLGIGRVVFAALNRAELALLFAITGALMLAGTRPIAVVGSTALVAGLLGAQLGLVRPILNRRSDHVLAGKELPRSRAHLCYVALEVCKVLALVLLGTAALVAPPARRSLRPRWHREADGDESAEVGGLSVDLPDIGRATPAGLRTAGVIQSPRARVARRRPGSVRGAGRRG